MDKMKREELVDLYRPDVERMAYFLPWLEGKTGSDVTTTYEADEHHATLAFPVYDEILLGFLNELSTTMFMDTNYLYLYSKYRIRDYREELALIEKADIMSMDILKGILSRYVLGGMTKAYLWTQGIEYKIFLNAVRRAKDIIEFWSVPLDIRTIDMDIADEQARLEAEQAAAAQEAEQAADPFAWGEPMGEEPSVADGAEPADGIAGNVMDTVMQTAETVVEQTAEEIAETAGEVIQAEMTEEQAASETEQATEEAAEQGAPGTEQAVEEAAEQGAPETELKAEEEAESAEAPTEAPKPTSPQDVEMIRGAEDVLVREEKPKKKPARKRTKKTAAETAGEEAAGAAKQEKTGAAPAGEDAGKEKKAPPKKTTRKRKPRTKKAEQEVQPASDATAAQEVKQTEGAAGEE